MKPASPPGTDRTSTASGTANGELYDMNQVTGAHKTLPMPSLVRVTNLENGRQIVVRVNDRGPFARSRVIGPVAPGGSASGVRTDRYGESPCADHGPRERGAGRGGEAGSACDRHCRIDPDQPPPPPPEMPSYTKTPATRIAQAQLPPPPVPARPPNVAVIDEQSMIRRQVPAHPIKGEDIGGRFLPAPQVSTIEKVRPSGIYIQAGSFSVAENAERLRSKLGHVTKTDISQTLVGGRTFYRVRIGPIGTVDEADQLLGRVVGAGAGEAKIIVD